jgi:hypothetical protein
MYFSKLPRNKRFHLVTPWTPDADNTSQVGVGFEWHQFDSADVCQSHQSPGSRLMKLMEASIDPES